MTREEWQGLRQGDVIRMASSRVLRVVLRAQPKGDSAGTYWITLLMLRESWRTPCNLTTVDVHQRNAFERTGWRLKHVPAQLLVCPHRDPVHQRAHEPRAAQQHLQRP